MDGRVMIGTLHLSNLSSASQQGDVLTSQNLKHVLKKQSVVSFHRVRTQHPQVVFQLGCIHAVVRYTCEGAEFNVRAKPDIEVPRQCQLLGGPAMQTRFSQ